MNAERLIYNCLCGLHVEVTFRYVELNTHITKIIVNLGFSYSFNMASGK